MGSARGDRAARRQRARSGSYRLDVTTQQWSWSDQVYRIHGFEPHEVVPTTELVLAHKDPDDRERSRAVLEDAARTGETFVNVYRLVDRDGHRRLVAVVGEGRGSAPDGAPAELAGFFIDVTDLVDDYAQATATAAIRTAVERRSVIDQAVGILAFSRAVTPAAAFAVLSRASQDANVPVRSIARVIVEAIPTLGGDAQRIARFLDRMLAPHHRDTDPVGP